MRIPLEPKTIGDHIRRKRLSMKLFQKDVAERIGVDKCLINNWECNHSYPHIRFIPVIIKFLGYNRCRRRRTAESGLCATELRSG